MPQLAFYHRNALVCFDILSVSADLQRAYTMLTTSLAQVIMHFAIVVHATALESRVLNQAQHAKVIFSTLGAGLDTPCVITASMHILRTSAARDGLF